MKTSLPILFSISLIVMATAAPGWAQNTVTIDTAGSPNADVSDWADEVCFSDDMCDDFPNQQDGKGACIASDFASTDPNPATTIFLRFDFDDTSVSGMNSLDGCWLVDVNQNGFVDNALCFSLIGDPVDFRAAPDGVRYFTCNDLDTDTCAGPTEITNPATCAVNNNTIDPDRLLDCGDGPDAAVECSLPLTDLGWMSGDVVLVWGCSSTSAQPTSATFDCVADGDNPLVIDPNNGDNTPVELLSFSVD